MVERFYSVSINFWIKLHLFFYIFYEKPYISNRQPSFYLYTRSFYQSHISIIICVAKKPRTLACRSYRSWF
ncbi:hypothetical protein [Listeria monocytogenes]|uniref:hypothetical protein n=1 Tax=Listeria monocytogenes TaxID=1639 RepID=UPI001EE14082|nr:hypothetical protein [Listeria monocytogenes]MCG3303598.1 hypothetical protein [Listeria monocytogenes]